LTRKPEDATAKNDPAAAERLAKLILGLRSQGVTDPAVLAAIERTPRDLFTPELFKERAWEDSALPIACGQTISQPYIVGLMTQALTLESRARVLEIGTGSGYQTAVLARLSRLVYTIERYRTLMRAAEARTAFWSPRRRLVSLRNFSRSSNRPALWWPLWERGRCRLSFATRAMERAVSPQRLCARSALSPCSRAWRVNSEGRGEAFANRYDKVPDGAGQGANMKPRPKTNFSIRILAVVVLGGGMAGPLVALAQETTSGPFQPRYPIHLSPPAPVTPVSATPAVQSPTPPPLAASAPPAPAPTPAVETHSLAPAAPSPSAPQTVSNDQDQPPPSETRRARASDSARRLIADGKVITATRMFRDYEIQKGDHLVAIARDFDTPADVLIEVNHLKSPDVLRPGQHLKVPVAKAYVAEAGDTITAVAKRFDLAPADLADLNNLPVKTRLRAGDKLALPTIIHDRGPIERPRLALAESDASPTSRPRSQHSDSGVVKSPAREASGAPYVPSQGALEAGARYRAEAQGAAAGSERAASSGAPVREAYARPAGQNAPAATETQIIERGRGLFIWPVRGDVLAPFGVMGLNRRNDGVDLKAPQGTVVRAAAAGEVVYAGDQVPGFGNLVLVKHAGGWVTAYAHLDRASVQMRQMVAQGDELGQVGESGGVSQPQLHFEIRFAAAPTEKARPIDPVLVLGGTPSS
jgi:murein DD-endopeptidase MepM/ murein hydrolase activator NlpD